MTRIPITLSCGASNDLLCVLAGNGYAVTRRNAPAKAVESAAPGSAVMILADGYPSATTEIPVELLESAARKNLRMLVEFPAALPGLEIGAPRAAKVERAVVASEFFGESLAAMRILAINGLSFVPVKAPDAHLVAARVAGFDTAVYGLPAETWPLLFEHPQGDILVATTKLSHCVTGRYAPSEAWRALWGRILRWICRDESIPEPRWRPAVETAFGRNDALPPDCERRAFRRGVEWFIKSKLLLDASLLGDKARELGVSGGLAASNPDGLAPTPPPDGPIGDGTLGIMEAPLSVIQADGNQLLGVMRRGDCTAESAMALAFGGDILGEPGKTRIAQNLLDFYLFTSEARKKERGDPKHGAYGLIAWGIDTPAWYVANYGDDNARLLLGVMAVAALTGDDRWDEAVMMCLLANLRTTGRLGFRGDRLDIPILAEKGWRAFFESEKISYHPHMESYLWACYLWAYRHTGFELFYQRAETAIRMTMEKYTDGWTWMNGLAQEKARILLPLAWLVRVKDTPEHRGWLSRAVDGILALQDSCGAIREELGLPESGRCPPPASNEVYGSNEASLIQRNGDQVTDLLYTANFAFLGLREATAATGCAQTAEAEDRLAEFLCRIQVSSTAHSALDGGWFRAFDYKRWEAWASNADAGWGAWAIESGWTQAWIVSVLAMRMKATSLWDLTRASSVNRHFARLRAEMLPDLP